LNLSGAPGTPTPYRYECSFISGPTPRNREPGPPRRPADWPIDRRNCWSAAGPIDGYGHNLVTTEHPILLAFCSAISGHTTVHIDGFGAEQLGNSGAKGAPEPTSILSRRSLTICAGTRTLSALGHGFPERLRPPPGGRARLRVVVRCAFLRSDVESGLAGWGRGESPKPGGGRRG